MITTSLHTEGGRDGSVRPASLRGVERTALRDKKKAARQVRKCIVGLKIQVNQIK